MKVLFFFNWEFTTLCHALALRLKERYGFKDSDFSGLAVQKKDYDFLKSQKDIQYSRIGVLSEYMNPQKVLGQQLDISYLRQMEKEYGVPNLWPFVYADRTLILYNEYVNYTREELLKFLQSAFRYTAAFLEDVKPDVVFFDCIASLPSYVLYRIAEVKGIKTVSPLPARIGNRVVFSSNPFEGFDAALAAFGQGKVSERYKKEAQDFLATYRNKVSKPEYMETVNLGVKKYFSITGQLKKIPRIFDYLYKYHFGEYKEDYIYKNRDVARALFEKIRQNMRRKTVPKLGIFEDPDYTKDFLFFPLHFEPEMTTMVMSPMYINQIPLVQNIAKAIPIDCELYVKEHPFMVLFGLRPASYYHELRKIPNVKLIRPQAPSEEVIRHSKLVFTITGTAGWEAALLKKPVISFGRVFYNRLNMVKKCQDISTLPQLIRDTLDNPPHDEGELVNFLAAIFEHSFEVRLSEMYGQADPVPFEKVRSHPDMLKFVDEFAREVKIQNR